MEFLLEDTSLQQIFAYLLILVIVAAVAYNVYRHFNKKKGRK